MDGLVATIVVRIIFCIVVGVMAERRGRSVGTWVALCFFTIPLVVLIVISMKGDNFVYYCPDCGAIEYNEANYSFNCPRCSGHPKMFFTNMRASEYKDATYSDQCKMHGDWKAQAKNMPADPESDEKSKPKEHSWQCSACGHTFTGWYKNCPDCKATDTMFKLEVPVIIGAEESIYCTKCGAKLDPDSVFCSECGEKVE